MNKKYIIIILIIVIVSTTFFFMKKMTENNYKPIENSDIVGVPCIQDGDEGILSRTGYCIKIEKHNPKNLK